MVFSAFCEDFVSPLFPKKGEMVELSIVFSERPDWVKIKYYTDSGLLWQKDMFEEGFFNGAIKYSQSVEVSSDEFPFSYFFVFSKNNKSFYYSNAGVTRNCPSRIERFKLIGSLNAPEWVARSTCYQIFADRFCNGDASVGAKEGMYEFDGASVTTPAFDSIPKSYQEAKCLDFYNGDLKGIESKVDYFKELGVDLLYLNPITCSRTVHRFDSTDFFHVDEKLGGDKALISLIDTMHKNGIKVIVDISINHTSSDSPWLKKALEDRKSIYNSFYVIDENGRPRFWQGVPTLVQLNYKSHTLRGRIYSDYDSALKKFLRPPFNQDGWRLDVAPEVARYDDIQLCQEIWRDVRKNLKSVKKDCYLVAEEWDDASDYLRGDMWDGTMNYFGCGRPIRSWLGERDRFLSSGWGHSPECECMWDSYEMVSALKDGISSCYNQMSFFQMNLFDSHDTPRLHNNLAIYDKDLYLGSLLVLYFLPGMPNIYYGDEISLSGQMGSVEGSRYPMQWDRSKWDFDTFLFYKKLGKLRKLRWLAYSAFDIQVLDKDAFAIKRISSNNALVAVVNKGKKRILELSSFLLPQDKIECPVGIANGYFDGCRLKIEVEDKKSAVLLLSNSK